MHSAAAVGLSNHACARTFCHPPDESENVIRKSIQQTTSPLEVSFPELEEEGIGSLVWSAMGWSRLEESVLWSEAIAIGLLNLLGYKAYVSLTTGHWVALPANAGLRSTRPNEDRLAADLPCVRRRS